MLNIIYSFLILPIEMIVEVVYRFMYKLLDHHGFAIIAVSIVIQTLVAPLYKRSDAIQDEERARQKEMQPFTTHIRRTFKGEERFMMLSAYYREKNYKSWYAIKSSASLMLQIPFFIAAYHYLSNLNVLSGESFLFITDLSKPDMAFNVFGIGINVLPILMTAVNILSGIIYTKGFTVKEKLQVYGLAVIFLVLLYNRPAGLVLYWTMNNVYSLVRNIIKRIVKVPEKTQKDEKLLSKTISYDKDLLSKFFFWETLFIALFIGAFIPLNVVKSSAIEFINQSHGPIYLVINNLAMFLGLFVLWCGIFFAFMKEWPRFIFAAMLFTLVGACFVNYMVFDRNLGIMTPLFQYDTGVKYSTNDKIMNLVLLLVVVCLLIALMWKKITIPIRALQILVVSLICICAFNTFSVAGQVKEYEAMNAAENGDSSDQLFHMSKDGNNVVVLMMDRAISGFIPYIFKENPEIAEMFEGFTYYPNTLSFGGHTNFGSPALYGGYEYTAKAMDDRDDELLKDKHNEALLLMPRIFADNGYQVVVCDPPYAGNYSDNADLSIFDEYDNIKAYTTYDKYTFDYSEQYAPSYQATQESILRYYCVMKILPLMVQRSFYNEGKYVSGVELGINMQFLKAYSVLLKLVDNTDISEDNENCFILLQNKSVHDPSAMKIPEYELAEGVRDMKVDYEEYYNVEDFTIEGKTLSIKTLLQAAHYQSTVASLRQLGKWFDYMRQNGCWDNTRVIIVSDHGFKLGNFDYMQLSDELDVEEFNPLLMVKDFDDKNYAESDAFMTNADVPTIALDGVVLNPTNPFTGKAIDSKSKYDIQYVTKSQNYRTDPTAYKYVTEDSDWYVVTPGNIFDASNWKAAGSR